MGVGGIAYYRANMITKRWLDRKNRREGWMEECGITNEHLALAREQKELREKQAATRAEMQTTKLLKSNSSHIAFLIDTFF